MKTFPEPQPHSEEPRPEITLNPVDSSQIKAIGYSEDIQTLAVQFARGTGAIYHYPNVALQLFTDFAAAESLGTFFGKHIKQLPFTKYQPAPT